MKARHNTERQAGLLRVQLTRTTPATSHNLWMEVGRPNVARLVPHQISLINFNWAVVLTYL